MSPTNRRRTAALLALFALAAALPTRPAAGAEPGVIELRAGLALPPAGMGGRGGRSALHADAVEALFVAGKWAAPREGDRLALPGGREAAWEPIRAGDDGTFTGRALVGGYVYLEAESDRPRVALLEASGHTMVYADGEPRTGDPYSHGYVHLPVRLREGSNGLLFHVGRGRLRARLVEPRAEAQIDPADATLPDLVVGQPTETWGALLVVNATDRPMTGLRLRASGDGLEPTAEPVPPLLPLGTRKVAFRLRGPAASAEGKAEVTLALVREGEASALDEGRVTLRVRPAGSTHKRTFRSGIDGSVQYFAVVPAREATGGDHPNPPGLILTLHGASVEGLGQAEVYGAKDWAHVVAPTNRRPYGFDWEDWGRLDAVEVLELASEQLHADPRRTYLTGHSMGGHGTWHLGVTYPDRWAAVAPSAGWVSMMSYAGLRRPDESDPVLGLIRRATNPSDTLALSPNLGALGVYVLHGDKDDNVPVDQARTMRQRLGAFHPDFAYYERPGAGHWWGSECCDWPPLMDFLARRTLPRPQEVRRIEFRTANPAVSARARWATVVAQQKALELSTIRLEFDPERRRIEGTTDNVARLALDLAQLPPGGGVAIKLDDQDVTDPIRPEDTPRLWLTRDRDGKWSRTERPSPDRKGPHRSGPFKEAFRHRFLLVHGTKGNADEDTWALARARYDAETFWYRGNGSVDVVADADFRPDAEPDRSVILYGNADTNAAWPALLGDGPVTVRRGSIRVGGREVNGDDLACLFVRPRPGSDAASVGVISGTGLAGLRLSDRLPVFVSGVGLPDLLILGPEMLTGDPKAARAAGYFGEDWGVESGEFGWRE